MCERKFLFCKICAYISFIWIINECIFYCTGQVYISPVDDALVYINGKAVTERTELRTGSRVIFGRNYVFRFNHPEQAAKERQEAMAKSTSSDAMSEFYGCFVMCDLISCCSCNVQYDWLLK